MYLCVYGGVVINKGNSVYLCEETVAVTHTLLNFCKTLVF